jgi:hypothetical protein
MSKQLFDANPRQVHDLVRRTIAVRHVRVIAEIDECAPGKARDKATQDGQSSVARIEHANHADLVFDWTNRVIGWLVADLVAILERADVLALDLATRLVATTLFIFPIAVVPAFDAVAVRADVAVQAGTTDFGFAVAAVCGRCTCEQWEGGKPQSQSQ